MTVALTATDPAIETLDDVRAELVEAQPLDKLRANGTETNSFRIKSLTARGLEVRRGANSLVKGLTLTVEPRQVWGVLGRNGTGKTTLLHALAGLWPATAGEIGFGGRPLTDWPAQELARQRGLLPQGVLDAFPATVLETVLVGRHPHLGRWQWEGREDLALAKAALVTVGLGGFEARSVQALSGGERQRIALAALLTQAPTLYLLDEPLAHLDIDHQVACLEVLRSRAHEEGAAVVMVLHDLNLAARYCDQCLLLLGDGDWLAGASDRVLTPAALTRAFQHPIEVAEVSGRRVFLTA